MNVGTCEGYQMVCDHGISYSCPALKLRGYRDDLALVRAIRRELKKRGIALTQTLDETLATLR